LGSGSIRAAFKPVSPCNFGKCREILTKCREKASVTQLKPVRSQKLEWGSPYSGSREGVVTGNATIVIAKIRPIGGLSS
jgi:hypothetical protein